MKAQDLDTGKYSSEIFKKASAIEAKAKSSKIRRTAFLVVILLVCLGGIFMGVFDRASSIERQYREYIDAPDLNMLSDELLSYKDVFKQFEASFLGNQACQSLMGGFFYDGAGCSIYPDEAGEKMLLRSGDKETALCDGLASDINVKNGSVYYRKLNSREVSSVDLSTGRAAQLPIDNVGQFIICGNKLFYIDLSASSLMSFDMVTSAADELIHSGVSAFAVAGNNIIYLDSNHTLYEFNISDHTQTTVGRNIAAFAYNGKLWMQNNEKVYCKALGKEAIEDCSIDIQCNRLLGATDATMYVESADGIYACSLEANTNRKIAKGIFIGASDEKVLIYDPSDSGYHVIVID